MIPMRFGKLQNGNNFYRAKRTNELSAQMNRISYKSTYILSFDPGFCAWLRFCRFTFSLHKTIPSIGRVRVTINYIRFFLNHFIHQGDPSTENILNPSFYVGHIAHRRKHWIKKKHRKEGHPAIRISAQCVYERV